MKIKVEFEDVSIITRWPCVLCGGSTEKHSIVPAFKDKDGEHCDVCEWCLEAGPEKVAERIAPHITRLENRVEFLRFLSQQKWDMPTLEDFKRAEMEKEAKMYGDIAEVESSEFPF